MSNEQKTEQAATYDTYECTHKTMISDDNGYLCPRYCGAGYPVTRAVPRRYARAWTAADASKAVADKGADVSAALIEGSTTAGDDNASVKPEVYARPAVAGEIPPSAIKLELLARTRGFRTAVTYARGNLGKKVSDSILVRGEHEDGRAFRAHYRDGVAEATGRKVRDPSGRVTDISAKDLTAWLTQPSTLDNG